MKKRIWRTRLCDMLGIEFPIVLAGIFVMAIAIVLANLVVDLLQSVVDPRIRMD